MAKNKTAKKTSKAQRTKQKQPKKPRNKDLEAYLQLVKDPCNAPLVPGPAIGSGRGIVSRFTYSFEIGKGVDQTGFVFAFFPTVYQHLSVDGTVAGPSATKWNSATTDSISLFNHHNSNYPGILWLGANAAKWRPLAACVQCIYTGAATNAAGLIGAGHCTANDFATPTTVSKFINNSRMVQRSGEQIMESIWRPSTSAAEPFGRETTVTDYMDDEGVYIAASGLPAASGMTIRVNAVVEWWPSMGSGNTSSTGPTVTFSPAHVLEGIAAVASWPWVRTAASMALGL